MGRVGIPLQGVLERLSGLLHAPDAPPLHVEVAAEVVLDGRQRDALRATLLLMTLVDVFRGVFKSGAVHQHVFRIHLDAVGKEAEVGEPRSAAVPALAPATLVGSGSLLLLLRFVWPFRHL